MTPAARTLYHAELWPAACHAKGWSPSNQDLRRRVVLECMEAVRGPLVTTSDEAFGPAETTALFAYLAHLANPSNLVKCEEWLKCKDDYVTYNRARQADWMQRQAYGRKGGGKLIRNRFAGARTAETGPLEDLDPKAVKQRLATMGNRLRRIQQKQAAGAHRDAAGQPVAAQRMASPAPAVDRENPF